MTAAAQPLAEIATPFRTSSAALEVLGYLSVLAVATLCFVAGWLTLDGAMVLCTLLLLSLIVLAWMRLGQGRHPCFLFLCTLMFFQGGGLLAYCLGAEVDPLRVQLMTPNAFYLPRDDAGLVLLLLALSAICIYAPCRWNYRPFGPPSDAAVRPYLPYLYIVFFSTLPLQLFKNYRYFEYAREHGGYTFIFVDHTALAASVPLLVRVIPLITFPTLIGIFVFERRTKFLALVTALYFTSASFILLLGSRAAMFSLILGLWYVARIKSRRKPRILRLMVVLLVLLMIGDAVSKLREDEEVNTAFLPLKVLAVQGASLNVTEVAVKYRNILQPFGASYLLRELQNAFVPNDAGNYYRGRALAFDISVLLNPALFAIGYGTGSSYVAEAYVLGGTLGVVAVSLLVGLLLHFANWFSRSAAGLFVVAMVLPEVLIMPRNGLLDWFSVLLRTGVSVLLLALGWQVYRFVIPTTTGRKGGALVS